MAAETTRKFEELEAQAHKLMTVFIKAGHEAVAPAVIQPAGVFLDVVGEALRARSYVFSDPDGDELCLRPDLTVPTCRLHLERHPDGAAPAKYCYNGTAFRFQPQGADFAHPREFRQAGIESFGAPDREMAEAETVATIIAGLQAAGLSDFKLTIGDLGLFRALLASAEMPRRWRERLRHHFWRREQFRAELRQLATDPTQRVATIPPALLKTLTLVAPAEAEKAVAAYLEGESIEVVGVRTVAEITEGLLALAADAHATPLSATTTTLIEGYIDVRAPALEASSRLAHLRKGGNADMAAALDAFDRRLDLLRRLGVDVSCAEFSAEFGRTLEYYTGFVFELAVPSLGPLSPVAGGGRYDNLLKAVGAPLDVPAVGAAVHTERLLAAVAGAHAGGTS